MNEKNLFLFLLIILFQNNIQDLEQFFFRCWAWNKHSSLSYACLDHEPNHFSENNPMNIMRWSHGSSIWDKGEYWIKILNFSLQRFQIWPMKQPPTSVQNCNRHVWAMVLSIQPCSGQGEARPPTQRGAVKIQSSALTDGFHFLLPVFSWSSASFLPFISMYYPCFLIITLPFSSVI